MMDDFDREVGTPQTSTAQRKFNVELKVDTEYFKGGPGIIKLIQLVLGLVLVCQYKPFWFAIPVYVIFMVTCGWSWLYFLGVKGRIGVGMPFAWNLIELYFTGGAALVYGLVSVISLLLLHFSLAVLGSQCTVAYAAGALLLAETKPRRDLADDNTEAEHF